MTKAESIGYLKKRIDDLEAAKARVKDLPYMNDRHNFVQGQLASYSDSLALMMNNFVQGQLDAYVDSLALMMDVSE